MSNNQDLIQSLEKTISDSQKSIRALNAVKDADQFIIVAMVGNTITSTASDGMNVSNAVASLSAAIRSYSEKLDQSEDLNALLSIVDAEVARISDRAQALEVQERTEYESPLEPHEFVDVTPEEPARKLSAVGVNAGVNSI